MPKKNNTSAANYAAFLAYQKQVNSSKTKKSKKRKSSKSKKKQSSGNGFGMAIFLGLMLLTGYFLTGCSYRSECDQTISGRGNIPASCRGVIYSGGQK